MTQEIRHTENVFVTLAPVAFCYVSVGKRPGVLQVRRVAGITATCHEETRVKVLDYVQVDRSALPK